MNNEYPDAPIELKYAPHECRWFCLGECCLPGAGNCYSNFMQCPHSKPKKEKVDD